MTDIPAKETTCPLCGADNQCAIAAGKPPQSCWCMGATLNEDAKAKAAEITDSQCICPTCGQAQVEENLER